MHEVRPDERLTQLARWCATGRYTYAIVPRDERAAIALVAILDAWDRGIRDERKLLGQGQTALQRTARSEWRAHGARRSEHKGTGVELDPRFDQYWVGSVSHRETFADRIIERHAVRQVLAALHPGERWVLTELANGRADNSQWFRTKLYLARRHAKELWFDWEHPAPQRTPHRLRNPPTRVHAHIREGAQLDTRNSPP